MRINSSYNINTLFSWIKKSSTLDIDLSQYKSIQNGTYHKALKEYYKTYDKDGKVKTTDKGLSVDEIIS